jgi:hypothetical protein
MPSTSWAHAAGWVPQVVPHISPPPRSTSQLHIFSICPVHVKSMHTYTPPLIPESSEPGLGAAVHGEHIQSIFARKALPPFSAAVTVGAVYCEYMPSI